MRSELLRIKYGSGARFRAARLVCPPLRRNIADHGQAGYYSSAFVAQRRIMRLRVAAAARGSEIVREQIGYNAFAGEHRIQMPFRADLSQVWKNIEHLFRALPHARCL